MKNYFSQFSYKVKKLNELKKILKKTKKDKTILCHGNFDVVHPGHVRHLSYAKTKGKILIVSLTADKFIKKGRNKPFVPENLRALNLAAFEMVDYVLIDRNVTPLNTVKTLKPDFFCKGFEYSSVSRNFRTDEESKAVKSYGGKMIFSPGDIIFSSTKFLNISEPNIEIEKVMNLMISNKIKFSDLYNTINNLRTVKAHVVGDLIIDQYTYTSFIGGQTKTPTPSVLLNDEKKYVGGAGVVAKHIKSAGADVEFTSVVGSDENFKFAKKDLKKSLIKFNYFMDNRPTTLKNAIISSGQRLIKIDKLDNSPISNELTLKILSQIKKRKNDIFIFSDFRHGMFHKKNISILSKSIPNNKLRIADTQVASRWGNILDFSSFDLITPNEKEVRFALADQDSNISELTRNLQKKMKFKGLILKLGKKGVFVIDRTKKSSKSFYLPSFAKNVVDPVGAGDALLAYSSLAFYFSNCMIKSSIIGNIAAAIECENDGNVPVKASDVIKRLKEMENISKFKKNK